MEKLEFNIGSGKSQVQMQQCSVYAPIHGINYAGGSQQEKQFVCLTLTYLTNVKNHTLS